MARKRKSKRQPTPRRRPDAPTNPAEPGFEPANKGLKYPVEVLSEAEAVALIRACSRRAPTGIRNKALIVLLWRAQLRITEALDLTPKDLDHDQCTVRVLHGKGDRAWTMAPWPSWSNGSTSAGRWASTAEAPGRCSARSKATLSTRAT